MSLEYDDTLKREVLSEFGSEIIAELEMCIERFNIDLDDESNPIVILYFHVIKMANNIYSTSYNTLEDLSKILNQFQFVKNYVLKAIVVNV